MTTETILTDEQVHDLVYEEKVGITLHKDQSDEQLVRATEQAVLQSEQVQAWKKDAEAFRLMVSKRLTVSVRELGHEVEVFYLDDCLAWPGLQSQQQSPQWSNRNEH